MASTFTGNDVEGEFEVRSRSSAGHAVDVLVGTPSKLLEMARGNGWDKEFAEGEEDRRRKWVVDRPEVDLCDVEWVVVDEADVLFGTRAPTHHSLDRFLTQSRPRFYRPDASPAERRRRRARQATPLNQTHRAGAQVASITDDAARLSVQLDPHFCND